MLTLSASTRIFLVAGVTDLRRSFNGLSAIVANELEDDPLSGHLYLFTNRRRNRLKVLYWDGSGLWACSKRLEEGTFAWPEPGTPAIELTGEEMALLIGGIDLRDTQKRRWYTRRASS